MPSVIRVFFGAIFRPGGAFSSLSSDQKRFRRGLRMMLLAGFLTAATAALLGTGGALLTAPAIIPLSSENYYFFQMIFALPLFAVLWLLSSTLGHGLASILGGRGSWKTAAAGLGFAFALPCLMIWIPQTIFGILLHTGMPQAEFMDLLARPGGLQTAGWIYHGLALAWMVRLSSAALRAGRTLSKPRALCSAVVATAAFAAGFLVFIR
jgi:hypothetical protein